MQARRRPCFSKGHGVHSASLLDAIKGKRDDFSTEYEGTQERFRVGLESGYKSYYLS